MIVGVFAPLQEARICYSVLLLLVISGYLDLDLSILSELGHAGLKLGTEVTDQTLE